VPDTDTHTPAGFAGAAWAIRLEPAAAGSERPWRLGYVSADLNLAGTLPRGHTHLTDTDVAALAATLLRPLYASETTTARARVLREGPGLAMRLLIDAVDDEAEAALHVQDHHRRDLLDDIARHRADLVPTKPPYEPRLFLDPAPAGGLGLDDVAFLHAHLGRWLDSPGVRAALSDRAIARGHPRV